MSPLIPSQPLAVSIELWTVNRWLRWSGFRLFIEVDLYQNATDLYEIRKHIPRKPTRIGLRFYGWRS